MQEVSEKTTTGAEDIHWDLTDLYNGTDDPQLQKDKQRLSEQAQSFADRYKGQITKLSAADLNQALQQYEAINEKLYKIRSFAHLHWATDTSDATRGKLLQESTELVSEINQMLVFFDVELMQIDDSRAGELIESNELASYRHHLETSRQYKEHILSEKEEQILSAKSVTGRSAWNRFFDETMGAARFTVNGEELTQQEALSKLHEPDRELRREAHRALSDTFRNHSRTLTFVFNTILADKATNDKFRNYPHWLKSRNLSNEIDDDTVQTLINTVTGNYSLVHRFYRLKKQLLGYEDLYDYDRYAPLLETELHIPWKEAKETVLTSYNRFHPQMADVASKFFEHNWIDAAIKQGKRGGAFSASTVPSVHPYVLVNYDARIRDVQTLAHELGHGVHQYLSREQGLLQADTPLTTAETASVFGEMLVFQNLMQSMDQPKQKLALLINKIDDTIATVFRQVSMNRFEDKIHNARREQGELSTGKFSDLWNQVQQDIYGDSVTITDEYKLWWCYIPHFLHTPGYVYAYAFGELLVLALYEAYKNSSDGFADRYLEMLKAGGSDWPENIVSKVGLDITKPDFWQQGIGFIEQMIEEAEQLAQEI